MLRVAGKETAVGSDETPNGNASIPIREKDSEKPVLSSELHGFPDPQLEEVRIMMGLSGEKEISMQLDMKGTVKKAKQILSIQMGMPLRKIELCVGLECLKNKMVLGKALGENRELHFIPKATVHEHDEDGVSIPSLIASSEEEDNVQAVKDSVSEADSDSDWDFFGELQKRWEDRMENGQEEGDEVRSERKREIQKNLE